MLKGINHQNFSVDGTKSNIIKEILNFFLPTSQIDLLIAKKVVQCCLRAVTSEFLCLN